MNQKLAAALVELQVLLGLTESFMNVNTRVRWSHMRLTLDLYYPAVCVNGKRLSYPFDIVINIDLMSDVAKYSVSGGCHVLHCSHTFIATTSVEQALCNVAVAHSSLLEQTSIEDYED